MRNKALINCPYCNQEIHSFQALGSHMHHKHPDKPKVKCLLEVTCSNCGRVIEKPPSHIREYSFCSIGCYLAWLPTRDYETKRRLSQNISNATKKVYAQGYRTPPCPNPKGSHLAKSTVAKMLGRIPWNRGSTKDTDVRIELYAKKLEGRHIPPETIAKNRQAMLICWRNPEYVRNQMIARQLKPNNTEIRFLSLLGVFGFDYVGDGREKEAIMGGKCPDYSNHDHKLIELFGDYWHRGENPQERINHFKAYSYDCLVIWEHELKDEQAVLAKIKQFTRRKK